MDMHALAEHFETHHVVIVGDGAGPAVNSTLTTAYAHSSDSSLAGALGPLPTSASSSAAAGGAGASNPITPTGPTSAATAAASTSAASSVSGAFDPDEMELDIDMEFESPPPGSGSSPSQSSTSSSPGAMAGASALPGNYTSGVSFQQRQQQARTNNASYGNAYGTGAGTLSAVSSPPDTPLLSTPVSPVHGFGNASFASWSTESSSSGFSTAPTTPTPLQPLGPPAFDSVHLPAKGSNTSFHPYARKQGLHHFNSMYALRTHGLGLTTSSSSSGFGLGLNAVQQQQQHANLLNARAMNAYAGYADYSSDFPGGLATANAAAPLGYVKAEDGEDSVNGGVQPGLLFGSTSKGGSTGKKGSGVRRTSSLAAQSSRTTPAQSRSGSPTSTGFPAGPSKLQKSASIGGASSSQRAPSTSTPPSPPTQSTDPNAPPASTTTLSRPAASLLLSKPFKCPTVGCMKSYKQANGLKYHVTHGQCSFTPPPELSSVVGLTEREAERRLRPYCCQVAPCTRRYKNMNGLRYHYQHSGDHGARGLAMLASGTHDPLKERTWGHEGEEDGEGGIIGANGAVISNATNPAQEEERVKERMHEVDEKVSRAHAALAATPSSARPAARGRQMSTSQTPQTQTHNHTQSQLRAQLQLHHLQAAQAQAQQQFAAARAQHLAPPQTPISPLTPTAAAAYFQSQPASAYASPWGSPRSGSPSSSDPTSTVNNGMNASATTGTAPMPAVATPTPSYPSQGVTNHWASAAVDAMILS